MRSTSNMVKWASSVKQQYLGCIQWVTRQSFLASHKQAHFSIIIMVSTWSLSLLLTRFIYRYPLLEADPNQSTDSTSNLNQSISHRFLTFVFIILAIFSSYPSMLTLRTTTLLKPSSHPLFKWACVKVN